MLNFTRSPRLWFFLLLCLTGSVSVLAQTRIGGRVVDAATQEPLAGVNIAVKGKVIGTTTAANGTFSLNTATPTPFTLQVSYVGYETQEVAVASSQTNLNIALTERAVLGQEVVVSASRVEENVLQSPVSIEKMDIRAIQQTAAPDFYTGLGNLKGIDLTTQSLTFKSVNMRGFGATGNVRITQLLDGMDNQAPGLNFPVDNIVGMPELDVESVEVIPGAASALYGPNALNGIILMNSKSPFRYQGLSAAVKVGVMSAKNRDVQTTPFSDVSIRYAKAFNNKFAFKFNAAYLQAKDWQATDYTNLNQANVSQQYDPARPAGTPPNFDGMNIYGDENIQTLPGGIGTVTRTGYEERDLVDYNTKSLKFNGALHYRLSEKVEAIAQVNYGTGTTAYTGNGRYSLRNFNLTQAKLELRGDNFNLRAYTTQERSGQSYTAGLQAIRMNEDWKSSPTWFTQYATAYGQARAAGRSDAEAHLAGRTAADAGRPLPGSEAFNQLRDKYAANYISATTEPGAAFLDKSNLYHVEGTYNLKNQIKFAEVLVGANYRVYQLRSEQTLFDDRGGSINIPEYGGFLQVAKALGPLKITASGRYDKNKNFEGRFTPRVAGVYTFAGDQNLRLSYQTGFRIPTTQNQYIDLLTPNARLIGALPQLQEKYNFANNPAYTRATFVAAGTAVQALALNTTFQNQILTPQVRAAIQAQVTAAVTTPANLAQIQSAVQPAVTSTVTTQVQAAVAAGQIPNNPAAIQAAIQAGVAAALPGAVQAAVTQTVTQQATVAASNLVQLRAVQSVIAQGQLQPYQFGTFKTEKVATWEIGYKGLIGKKLFFDAYYYRSRYTDLVGGQILLQSKLPTDSVPQRFATIAAGSATRNAYSVAANSTNPVIGQGWALGLDYALPKGYTVGGNWSFNELVDFQADAAADVAFYNTPKNRFNLSVGKRITPSTAWGFNVNFRHQDAFTWEAGFVQASDANVPLFTNTIVPANNIVDAQVSFKLPSLKSIVKIGGTNILNTPYIQAFGNPTIGGMYYVSLNFDELLN
jgi:outer membrane receptor protein involved in Fe transport